jgi:hypothetical protein
MIVKILDRYINISAVREVAFDGKNTLLMFDSKHSESFPGDFREALRQQTGGPVFVAANGRP